MKIYTLTNRQHLPISREEAWNFLSSPAQLENITSDNLSFQPLAPLPLSMYEGMIIGYQLKPFLNIRMQWVTEITHIEEGKRFIDEQRFGPFRFWHHEHCLNESKHGIEIQDTIHYVMPFSIFGRIVHRVYIRKMLEATFSYRKQQIEAYFS